MSGLLAALAGCLIEMFATSDLLLDNAPKISQDASCCLLVSGGTVGIHSAASENVSQKDEPLVLSRIAKALQKIIQPRLQDRIVGIVHRYDPRLGRACSAEQDPVDHGIELSLLETGTDELILVLSPSLTL